MLLHQAQCLDYLCRAMHRLTEGSVGAVPSPLGLEWLEDFAPKLDAKQPPSQGEISEDFLDKFGIVT